MIVELNINNSHDWVLLKPLLERLKINFVKKSETLNSIDEPKSSLEELTMLLNSGVDASYYGDPVQYQKDIREDSSIPFRD